MARGDFKHVYMNYIKLLRHEKELEKAIPNDLILYHNRHLIKDKNLKHGDLYCVVYYLNPDNLRFDIAVYVKDSTFVIYTENGYTKDISFKERIKLFDIIHFDNQPYNFTNVQIDPNAKN